MNYQQDDWTNWLAAAEFQYNDKQHAATGKTPFELNFGRHPWKGDLMVKTDIPQVEDLLSGLQKSWEQVTKAMEEAQRSMKKLAGEAGTTVAEMEGNILMASIDNRTTNATNITQMVEDLCYLTQSDMDDRVFQI